MSTELATTNGNHVQVHLGERDAISQIRDRIVSMMPGAAEAPADVVWAAAQLAVAHELNPFNGEVYIMSTGRKKVGNQWVDDYRAHVGVKGLRKKAREQAELMTEFRDMTEDEVKRHRRGDYDPDDIGVECSLYRLDVATTCQRIGIPYKPVQAVGFWRKKAKKGREGWKPDNTPNTWSDHQGAKKRAEINAIKEAFDLVLNVADPSVTGDANAVDVLSRRIEAHDRDHAIPTTTHMVDDDGIFAIDVEPAQFTVDDEPEITTAEFVDDLRALLDGDADGVADDDGTDVDNRPLYRTVRQQLTDQALSFANWAMDLDRKYTNSCSEKQYQYRVSLINSCAGSGAHRNVLSVLLDADISKPDGRLPGAKIASKLIDVLSPDSEHHRNDVCGIVECIGQLFAEQQAEPQPA